MSDRRTGSQLDEWMNKVLRLASERFTCVCFRKAFSVRCFTPCYFAMMGMIECEIERLLESVLWQNARKIRWKWVQWFEMGGLKWGFGTERSFNSAQMAALADVIDDLGDGEEQMAKCI